MTTHKIDLYQACHDLFDEIDPAAALMGETSCLSKRDGRFRCHAKDPVSSGLALDAFIPTGYWAETGAECLLLGAGGSAIAISWYLTRPERGADRPTRIVVTNRSAGRLDTIRRMHADLGTDVPIECVTAPDRGRQRRRAGPPVTALPGRERHRARQGRPRIAADQPSRLPPAGGRVGPQLPG